MSTFFEQIIFIFTVAGIVQGPYIALLLRSRRVRKTRANLFLSILLIALSFSIAHILYAGHVVTHISLKVYSFGDPTFLLIGPLLWFYVSELTGQKVKGSGATVKHFIPFALIILFSLSFRSIQSDAFAQFIDRHQRAMSILFWMLVVAQLSMYYFLLQKKLSSYRHLVRQEVSNPENLNLSWVKFFMAVFLVINLFFLFSLVVVMHVAISSWHFETTAFLFSLCVFALGYRGILQKEIFFRKSTEETGTATALTPSPTQDPLLIHRLKSHVAEKKPYLDPELTLTDLAHELSLSRGQLSLLINSGIGDNFYDFINKYRVEEVKQLMMDPKRAHFSLLGLAMEAGFKSKSTFNLIFKRFTGLTPGEYRRNLSSPSE